LRPGPYSCRVTKFSPLEFDVADGGTYYVLVDSEPGLFHIKSGSLSLATAAGVVDPWNAWMQKHPSGGKAKDLTKIDPALFSKLPPSLRAKQP
jgi:proline racemase